MEEKLKDKEWVNENLICNVCYEWYDFERRLPLILTQCKLYN